ncbi:hypothetical protein BJF78_16335 [Pseudonocardia sp. CNS-139]|nr:hypothetical protein BJF78_16335 [Pseudonocardia sp. CNS-139]
MTRPNDDRFTRLVEWVTAVAAPLTALTAVLYFFGWTRTNALFRHFGVDPAILDLDVADHLARAAGPAFAPAVALVAGSALYYALDRAAPHLERLLLSRPVRVRGRLYVLRGPSVLLSYAGVVLLWCGVRIALQLPDVLGVGAATGITDPIAGALAIAAGALLLSTGVRLLLQPPVPGPVTARRLPVVARVLLVTAIAVAVFWAAAVYSQRTGESYAAAVDANPAIQPAVVVQTAEPIGLWSATPPDAPDSPDGRLRYTYTGLRLLIYANDRWVLLTGERNAQGRLTVVILHDSDDLMVRLSA